MGCVGDVIVAGGIDALNNSDTVFVADFLRELFGNIARYADPTQRYVVLVSAAQDHVTIDVTDRPRQGGTGIGMCGRNAGSGYCMLQCRSITLANRQHRLINNAG
ncbi:MAG: hypothetical protein E7B73_04620 [Bifidobacterium longum]|nr:hypothetical protein [Bifidobacterium longum]